MQKALLFFLLLLLSGAPALAQVRGLQTNSEKAAAMYDKGVKLTQQRLYKNAIAELEGAIKKDNDFAEAYLRLASVYRAIGERTKARDFYLQGFKLLKNQNSFYNEHFYLAELLLASGDYEGAASHLDLFRTSPNPNRALAAQADRIQSSVEFAVKAMKNPVNFKPDRLEGRFNQLHQQYFPTVTADEQSFLFTGRVNADATSDEDIYISQKQKDGGWSNPEPVSAVVNSPANEGAASISGDGKVLVFTACDRPDSFGGCDLYISYRESDNWSEPKNIGRAVNSSSWDSQPSLSADGRTIIFASKRPGGQGKDDLWITRMDEKNEWQKPVNLGTPINTAESESSPCLHASGSTLYFASDGHPGMGGSDLFRSDAIANGGWTDPVNLGYPLNSPSNESTIFVDAANKKGYYSKEIGGGRQRRMEIFSFDLPAEWKSKVSTIYAKGKVYDAKTKLPVGATIDLFNLANGELASRVTSDKKTGEYVVVLNEGQEYSMYALAEKYMPHSQHFDFSNSKNFNPKALDIYLNPIEAGGAIVLENLFFKTGEFRLEDKSKTELDQVAAFLKNNLQVKVEISGHTDDVGSETDNQVLSEKRAKAVQDYLVKQTITAGRIVAKGFGEQKPANPNDTDENRAKNRRIEMRIL